MEPPTSLELQNPPPPPKFRSLVRQNSEQLGAFAETAVLPINKRSFKKKPTSAGRTGQVLDVEGQRVEDSFTRQEDKETSKHVPKKFPYFMVSISAIQVFLYYYGDDYLWLYLCNDPFRRHELWRYFTAVLVHGSGFHLWGNVIFQLILGVLLEVVHHWKRIGIIYLCGVLGGSLLTCILNPSGYALGASDGVYALLTAHLATIIMNWNQMDHKCCRLFWLLLYISYDVGTTIYDELVLKVGSNTSHSAHFGGALLGFVVAVFVLRNFEKLPWERRFQKILGVVIIILFGVIIIVNVALPSYFHPTAWNFEYFTTYLNYALEEIKKMCPETIPKSDWSDECKEVHIELSEFLNKTSGNGIVLEISSTSSAIDI